MVKGQGSKVKSQLSCVSDYPLPITNYLLPNLINTYYPRT
ncbi:hypothetical protein FDUTEX481_09231 [Tolypothrix sp. PCC 7601]|nr:hypothetical protein FDUTEX481_09231 [Tolypothrix sp. PCC 7601]